MSLSFTHCSSFLQSPLHHLPNHLFHNSSQSRVILTKNPLRNRTISANYTSTLKDHTQMASPSSSSSSSLYEVLGIPVSASCHEIKLAYRRLARVCHPDVVAVNQKETSANEFKKIHSAYSTLSDPNKRADYDRDLYLQRWSYDSSSLKAATMAAASSAMSGFSGYTHKNWETDQCW